MFWKKKPKTVFTIDIRTPTVGKAKYAVIRVEPYSYHTVYEEFDTEEEAVAWAKSQTRFPYEVTS